MSVIVYGGGSEKVTIDGIKAQERMNLISTPGYTVDLSIAPYSNANSILYYNDNFQ